MKYRVTGLAPALGKQANELLKACALGGEGAFVYKTSEVELSGKGEKDSKIPALLKQYYENDIGWHNVSVST